MVTVGDILLWLAGVTLVAMAAYGAFHWQFRGRPFARASLEAGRYIGLALGVGVGLLGGAAILFVLVTTGANYVRTDQQLSNKNVVVFDKKVNSWIDTNTIDTSAWLNFQKYLPSIPNFSVVSKATGLDVVTAGERIVPLLYATSRAMDLKPDYRTVGYRRSQQLSYGSALVRVPEDHRIGHVERPRHYVLGWMVIYGWITYDEPESEKSHFVVKGIQPLTEEGFIKEIKKDQGKSALVFVHGFNTTFEEALYRTAQIVWDLKFFGRGPAIAFSWASEGGVANYDYDRESAEAARPLFAQLLEDIGRKGGISKIFVVAHSMGNQVVGGALTATLTVPKPTELILAAPDVDRDVFIGWGPRLVESSGKVTLYVSAADKALLASKLKAHYPRAGDVPADGPIVLNGIETVDVTAVGDELFGLNHNTFAGNRSLIDDIGRMLYNQTHPPGERSPQIRGVPEGTDSPRYWRYAP